MRVHLCASQHLRTSTSSALGNLCDRDIIFILWLVLVDSMMLYLILTPNGAYYWRMPYRE